jgi:hypothetical protein
MEAVQKRPGVLVHRLLQPSRLEGGGEGGQVAREVVGIDPQVAGAEEDLVPAHLLAEGVQRLVEPPAGPLLVAFAPEEAEQPVARDAAVTRGREERQESQAAGLGRGSAQPLAVTRQEEPTERVKP